MRAFRTISDKLVNLVAGLGTSRDKGAASTYAAPVIDDAQLVNAYRGAWLPRKIVDIPAQDSTRKWREWYAGAKEIEILEAEENRLGLRAKVREAITKARLFGGAAIFIGTGDADPSKPLALDRIRKGGVKYLAVMSRLELQAGDIENDVLSPGYGKPKHYRAGNVANIHPSRLAIFIGAPLPDVTFSGVMHGWGDSVLTAMLDAIQQSDNTMANMASLVFESKVDIFRLPDFMDQVNSPAYRNTVLERLSLAAVGKGVNGVLLMDKEEEYESKSASFGGLPDVADRFLQAVAGAADIPATRLLGQAPQGMSSTGEGDLKNYYDRVQSMQTLDIGPALATLDEALIRSATGARDPSIYYEWASLWQTTPKENADIGKVVADTLKVLADTSLLPSDVLSKAAETTLIERGVLPGLESALAEYGMESDDGNDQDQ